MTYEEGEATSVTGNKLFTAEYLPNPGPPVAILMMHHGLAEHIGRYKDCACVQHGLGLLGRDALLLGSSRPGLFVCRRLDRPGGVWRTLPGMPCIH